MKRKTKVKITLFAIIHLIVITIAYSQDADFSQFYAAPLYLNPALAGGENDVYLAVNQRKQWKSENLPVTLGQVSFIYPIYPEANKHIGSIGLSVFSEAAGENKYYKSAGAYLTGSYNLYINNTSSQMISFGLQGGLVNNKIDYSKFIWGSQLDPYLGYDPSINPSLQSLAEQRTYPLFNSGIMWYYSPHKISESVGFQSYLGFSVANLNMPNQSFIDGESSKLPILYKVHGGLEFVFAQGSFSVSPNAYYLIFSGKSQLNAGAYLSYNLKSNQSVRLMAGFWYRNQESIIFSAGVQYNKITLGMSYDRNTFGWGDTSSRGGAMEISASYRFSKFKNIKRFSTPMI